MLSSEKRRPVVVLDSNVWVSAIIWGGKPARIINLAEQHSIVIAISEEMVDEIRRILSYDKLESIYTQAGITQTELLGKILSIARFVRPKSKVGVVKEDPSDNRVIECALAAKAGHIVSGNEHLLRMRSYAGIEIISVKGFLEEVKAG